MAAFNLANVLVSFGGSALVIHSFMWGDLLYGTVAAIHFFMWGDLLHAAVTVIHSFKCYMEQIIFDSRYLLRMATFLDGLFQVFNIVKSSLFISPL